MPLYTDYRFREVSPFDRHGKERTVLGGVTSVALQPSNRAVKHWMARSAAARVDLNKPRMREAVRAALALAPAPNGFTVAEFTAKVHALTGVDHTGYSVRQAAYDLRKLRGKQLIDKPSRSRRYVVSPLAARTIAALLALREQGIAPILANVHSPKMGRKPAHWTRVDRDRIRIDMQNAVHRSRHRNTPSRLRIRREPVTPHHQQIVESRSSSG
jgi:hypothetical protein